jgi:hypothetical protein
MSANTIVVSTEMSDLKKYFDDKFIIAGTSNRQLQRGLKKGIETVDSDDVQRRNDLAREWIKSECARRKVGGKILELIDKT